MGFSMPYLDTPVTHLFFMDDLKMYAESQETLGDTLGVMDRVSHVVGMELGLRKCAVPHVRHGKVVDGENYLLPGEWTIECVVQGGTYRYLGIEQVFQSDHTTVRERLIQAYSKRLNWIWSSSLSSKHKAHPTNTWAVAVFRYFFAQVKWPDKTLVQLDMLTHKILQCSNSHHYSASIEQLYLRQISGGRGLVNIHLAYEREVVVLGLYLVESVQDELCRWW